MKITKLTTYIVPPRWCFLRIDTDEGIVGWGEPVLEGRAHTVAAAVDELSDYLTLRISKYKVPKRFVFIDALPRTPYGKVVKEALRHKLQ